MRFHKYTLNINRETADFLKKVLRHKKLISNKYTEEFQLANRLYATITFQSTKADKDIGINCELKFKQFNVKYLFKTYEELFQIIEIRDNEDTYLFKFNLFDIDYISKIYNHDGIVEHQRLFLIEKSNYLLKIKDKNKLLQNLIIFNDFTNELDFYEVLYVFIASSTNFTKTNRDLLKDKLAYFGYDESFDEDDEDNEDDCSEILKLALTKLYNPTKWGDNSLEKPYLLRCYIDEACKYIKKENS